MSLKHFFAPIAAISLLAAAPASAAAVAAGPVAAPIALASGCGSAAVAAGAAVAAQAVRPGCVLPAIDTGVPVSTAAIGTAGSSSMMAGWLLPVLGLAALAGLVLAIAKGKNNGSGSLSRA